MRCLAELQLLKVGVHPLADEIRSSLSSATLTVVGGKKKVELDGASAQRGAIIA